MTPPSLPGRLDWIALLSESVTWRSPTPEGPRATISPQWVERMADEISARLRSAFDEHARQAVEASWWPTCELTGKKAIQGVCPEHGGNSCLLASHNVQLQADLAACVGALRSIEHVTNDPNQWDLWKVICQVHSDADAALARATKKETT